MKKQLKEVSISDINHALGEKDEENIPTPCQKCNVSLTDIHKVQNESISWLKKIPNGIPIWSRLNFINCLGQPRDSESSKMENYDVEIPGRLISMFGTRQQQTTEIDNVMGLENYQLVACALSLCSALKYDLKEWSPKLLDNIISKAIQSYPDILHKPNILDENFGMDHLNQVIRFQDSDYQITQQQVATGFLYIPYGLSEFNLARALNWFFRRYQFGILQCCNRTLAFGFSLNTTYGFFMYDCQTRGHPLFKDQQYNSYILRTNHLQILLYCMIVTLNISLDRVKFFMYNVDVRIVNPLEMKKLKKEVYVPTIAGTDIKSMVVKPKVDCGQDNKKADYTTAVRVSGGEEDKKSQATTVNSKVKQYTSIYDMGAFKESRNQSLTCLATQVISKPYKLNQKSLDREVINNMTTIKKANRIFNAMVAKVSKPPPEPNAHNTTTNQYTAKVTQAPIIPPKPQKVTLKRVSLANLSKEKPTPPKAASAEKKTFSARKNSSEKKTTFGGKNSLEKKSSFKQNSLTVEALREKKPPRQTKTKTSQKIPIDPNKNYYIIAVPRESNTDFTISSNKINEKSILINSQKDATLQTVKLNIHRVNTVKPPTIADNCGTFNIVHKEEMNIDLPRTESERTLTNNDGISEPTDSKIFLIDNSKACGLRN